MDNHMKFLRDANTGNSKFFLRERNPSRAVKGQQGENSSQTPVRTSKFHSPVSLRL